MTQSGLIFPFAELRSECQTLKTYAGTFLDKLTIPSLDEAKSMLENIQTQGSAKHAVKWFIPEDRPLCTIWSKGESQPQNRSGYRVRAKLSFVWQILPLEVKRGQKRINFVLDGMASTRITVVEDQEGSERCLAQWTVEVGDHQSPGTHFHFQLNGFDEPPFPKSLDIPRLPAPVMSPFLAMDFVIGELFQDRWARHSAAESQDSQRWRNLHQERLRRFFEWQRECVTRCTGSPWMALKQAKPPRDLFVA